MYFLPRGQCVLTGRGLSVAIPQFSFFLLRASRESRLEPADYSADVHPEGLPVTPDDLRTRVATGVFSPMAFHFQHILEAIYMWHFLLSPSISSSSRSYRHFFLTRWRIESATQIEHHEVSFVGLLFSFAFDVLVASLDRLRRSASFEVLFYG
jgi:hypothetical protein